MFRFNHEQTIHNIRGVRIGGQPGELPTVLCGSIFYEGHSIVEDAVKGKFDKERAENLINNQASFSDETGNPHIIQIYGRSLDALVKYMEFVHEVSDAPMMIDSTEGSVRSGGALYSTEVGLSDSVIYNSMNVGMTESEISALKSSDIDTAIVLAFNPIDSSLKGRIELLENGSGILNRGLLELAEECGIKKVLVDTGATPIGSNSGVVLRLTLAVKGKYGLPTGSGIHNIPLSWQWLRERKKDDPVIYRVCDISTVALQQIVGGDFVLYGPIENAKYAFACAAMTDILIAEGAIEFIKPSSSHPINKLK